MPRRIVPLVPGECYHIYNRGHNRSTVFRNADDDGLFIRKFHEFVAPAYLETLAYVLMPNHYHLIARVQSEGASPAMRRFGISVSQILNRQYGRVGTMFQGPFQAKPVPDDNYLLHLSKYIHLNPLRARLVTRLEDWTYSSFLEYAGLRNGSLPNPRFIMDIFDPRPAHEATRPSRYADYVLDSQELPPQFDPGFE